MCTYNPFVEGQKVTEVFKNYEKGVFCCLSNILLKLFILSLVVLFLDFLQKQCFLREYES